MTTAQGAGCGEIRKLKFLFRLGTHVSRSRYHIVMAGLDPAIYGVGQPPNQEAAFRASNSNRRDGVDGRNKSGHDGGDMILTYAIALLFACSNLGNSMFR